VGLRYPTADHSQPGYPVRNILTEDATGWGAYEAGLTEPISQSAVVETTVDVGVRRQVTELTFTLSHQSPLPEGLCLGRFRLSVTTDDRASFADGLDNGGAISANWQVLTPTSVRSVLGTPLTVLADGSVLAPSGAAGLETYYVTCRTELAGITGFRIEALEDPTLPRKAGGVTEGGPGLTAGEGNFVLTYFGVHQRAVTR
jgi:hypothetical protein